GMPAAGVAGGAGCRCGRREKEDVRWLRYPCVTSFYKPIEYTGMQPRAVETPKRRAAEMLAAAAKVFAQRGYHGASTQDIADVLGIRQASLYYYFASKEFALEQVCARGVEGYVEAASAIAAGPGTAADKVRRLLEAHLSPMLDRADFVLVFQRERRHLPDDSRR